MQGGESQFQKRLLRWYDAHRRDLPWRKKAGAGETLDPYHVLVSEAMLQQTQVATVIPYFERFLKRFPTIDALAAAPEQEVLRLWQGLGYYSRARNLQLTARRVVEEHGGELPRSPEALRKLPGIGRYTAGAVASIAFDVRAPIVDGNVARVLCRIDRIESDPREKMTGELLWQRAAQILPNQRCGDFNSALMELGATVCTPRTPKCLLCPVREHCAAQAAGVQEQIPPPRKVKENPLLKRDVFCLRRGQRWLIEQRPRTGRWPGMWQFVTLEAGSPTTARARAGEAVGAPISAVQRIGSIAHVLTHRRYEFHVYQGRIARAGSVNGGGRVWATLAELDRYPLPRPHLRIAALVEENGASAAKSSVIQRRRR